MNQSVLICPHDEGNDDDDMWDTPHCVLICPRACPTVSHYPTVHSLFNLSRPIKPFCCISWLLNVSVSVFMRAFLGVYFSVLCTCINMPPLSTAILSFCILIQAPILSLCTFVCAQPNLICHIFALVQQFISYFGLVLLTPPLINHHCTQVIRAKTTQERY